LEVRNIFHEGVEAEILKYITSFNYYRCRNDSINKGLVGNKCPYYNWIEIWEYVILHKGASEIKLNT